MNPPLRFADVLSDARRMVQLCADVYADPVDILSGPRDTQVNVRLVQTSVGTAVAVVFRGTCSLYGWVEDAQVSRQAIEGSLVHRGFMADVLAVVGEIEKRLDQNLGSPIYIAGHSKGGAEAMLLAWVLKQRGRDISAVYTFGQPRFGDATFAAQYDRWLGCNTWRFTHGSDVVPWVPWLAGKYVHAGHEVYMPCGDVLGAVHSADYKVDPSTLYKLMCDGRETWKALKAFKLGDIPQTSDHHIGEYVGAVEALVEKP